VRVGLDALVSTASGYPAAKLPFCFFKVKKPRTAAKPPLLSTTP
jgi:hypothetical protein